MPRGFRRILCLLCCIGLPALAGCGNKGPLYRPESASAAPASTTVPADQAGAENTEA